MNKFVPIIFLMFAITTGALAGPHRHQSHAKHHHRHSSSSSVKASEGEIIAAATEAFIQIERALHAAARAVEAALIEEDPAITVHIQEILANATQEATDLSQTALAAVEAAETQEEVLAIALEFIEDLKALGYQTKAAVEAAAQSASSEAVANVQAILDQLVEDIRVALQPLEDLLTGGRKH